MSDVRFDAARTLENHFPFIYGCWCYLKGDTWQACLAKAALPEAAEAVVADVVQRSRLTLVEKKAVTEDLSAHFQDGLHRGETCDQLLHDFGDSETVAQLIRISKLRNRSMLSKVVKGTFFSAMAVIFAYVFLSAYFHMGKPNPTTDYTTLLNANIVEKPESDKAWPLYRASWTRHEFSEGLGGRFEEIYVQNEDGTFGETIRPGDRGWEGAIAKLQDSQDLLDAFRKGAKLPSLGVELYSDPDRYSPEDFVALFPGRDRESFHSFGLNDVSPEADQLLGKSLIGILLPHIQSFRKAARIFTVDTRWAMEQGDLDRVVENVETVFGLAPQASESKFLVCGLVGIAIQGMGVELVEEILENEKVELTDEQLARIQAAIVKADLSQFVSLEGERASTLDLIQRCYTDDGNGDGRITPVGYELLMNMDQLWGSRGQGDWMHEILSIRSRKSVFAPSSLLLLANRKQTIEKMEEWLEVGNRMLERPYWIEGGSVEDLIEAEEDRSKYALLERMFPAIDQVRMAMIRTQTVQDAASVAVASHRFKLANGRWPETIDELDVETLSELRPDPHTGKSLQLRATETGVTVYSFGADKDDDGGKPIVETRGEGEVPVSGNEYSFAINREEDDGDWVIWPYRNEE